jgi:hypothetical protein
MRKSQGRCIYCGGAGLTKEHLYASWLRPYILSRVDRHGINFDVVSPGSASHKIEMRSGDTHARKIRRVCGGGKSRCNNGWMSQLQEETKPILLPLITGQKATLSRKDQKALSAWAAMTAMTGEFLGDNEEFVAVPQTQRDYLRIKKRPPRGWRIWIGRYSWTVGVERWTHHVMCLAENGYRGPPGDISRPPNTQTTTICVGDELFIHIMSSSVDSGQSLVSRWNFPPSIAPAFLQIFPAAAEKIIWPPPRTITPVELKYVANTFFERCQRSLKSRLNKGNFR